jgi:hypothetical protein
VVGDLKRLAGQVRSKLPPAESFLLTSDGGNLAAAVSVQSAMNKLLWLIFLAATPVSAQSRLVFAWKTNPANAGTWPACSTLVVKMCRIGYTLTDVTATSAPVIISSTITEDALTYTLSPLPSAGLHLYNLTIDAKGSSGVVVHSAPARVKVEVPVPGSHARLADSGRDQNRTQGASIPAIALVMAGGAP